MVHDSFIYDYVRTPFGRYGKSLADTRPDDLAALVLGELARRNPQLSLQVIDDVIMGATNGAGEDNRNVARMGSLLAGFPTSIPGTTVNRLCGSGMEATIQASRAIESGDARVLFSGGVESMSRAPWVMQKPRNGFPAADATLHSTTIGWRMTNPAMDPHWTIPLGETAEILADRYGISRDEQDKFAVRSHQRAAAAWADGTFIKQIVMVPGTDLSVDEGIRPNTTLDTLRGLKPAFRIDGSVTAGNSSPLTDGAAALLIAGEDAGLGDPIARIVSRGVAANDPDIFGIAPVEAANKALARAGFTWADVDFVELNEAFAAQALSCTRLWDGLDPDKLNVDGGAIAIGHPLGASGARVIGQLARKLEANGGGIGVAAICIGVGQGLAVVLER
ncbi:thiolase family protein [Cryobacterium ruanii]|uniref:Probable acetyl-CoA acetyltransferase n=1 Tax=Cryobacterium ruanii TaxID=1259197 RepID=A0A4R9AM26_9MICO|nr:thiolase family protein [Cryobacterium ruanii]TFD65134.1 thiolase family protein [Cryobacterium ruanii]